MTQRCEFPVRCSERIYSSFRAFIGKPLPTPAVAIALTLLLIVGLFFPLVVFERRLAFRDLGHFYEPLYRYLDERSEETWFPLWSSLDQTGIPLAGDSTTALFYPLRLLSILPVSIELRIICSIVVHLVIAGVGVFYLCRFKQYTFVASWCAALAYCGSGAVFHSYCNPPFLVGAAWLPWMFRALVVERASRTRNLWVTGVIAMASSILGGDPQIVYNLLLITLATHVGKCCQHIWRSSSKQTLLAESFASLQWIGSISLLASLLAAPQIAASWQWSQLSWRRATATSSLWSHGKPDSSIVLSVDKDSLANQPLDQESHESPVKWRRHAESMYDFSIAPWHLIEVIWPYFSGKLAPENQRWLDALPLEPRTWTPTLYLGLLAAVSLIVAVIRFRSLDLYAGTLFLAVSCAFGSYGFGFFFRAINGDFTSIASPEADAFGGPYWFLAKCAPGYNLFRYPAKWLVFVSLASSVITARFVSDYHAERANVKRQGAVALMTIIALSILCIAVSYLPAITQNLSMWLNSPRVLDRFWGPVRLESVLWSIRLSALHTTMIAMGLLVALNRKSERLLILVVLIDLSLSCHWLMVTSERLPGERLYVQNDQGRSESQTNFAEDRVWLVVADNPWPTVWRTESGDDRRVNQVELAQRSTWFVRWHLADSVHVMNNQVSLPAATYEAFRQAVVNKAFALEGPSRLELYSRICNFLGCHTIATRGYSDADNAGNPVLSLQKVNVDTTPFTFHSQVRLHSNRNPQVNSWDLNTVVDEIYQYDKDRIPLVSISSNTGYTTFDSNRVIVPGIVTNMKPGFSFQYQVRRPEYTALDVETEAPGFLRWVQMQDGNWYCRYRTSPSSPWVQVESFQVDGVAQGVFLPAGKLEVIWEYQPRWWSLSLCAFACGMLGVGLVCLRTKRW